MTRWTIRAARPGDAGAITRVIEAAYASHAAQGIDLPPVSAGVAQAIDETPVRVAEANGAILGVAVLRHGPERAQLENLAVSPEAGGQGIGRALLRHVEQAARAMGHTEIVLATHRDMAATRAFYAWAGWTETGQDGPRVTLRKPL